MMKFLVAGVAVLMLGGCSNDEVVYRPHFNTKGATAPKTDKVADKPKPKADIGKVKVVDKVGNLSMSSYGIPIYPGSVLDKDTTLAYTSSAGVKEIQVTLESTDDVTTVTEWYRDHIKPTAAYVVQDKTAAANALGTLEGTTQTGRFVRISVANVDAKTIIALTVADNAKK